MSYTIRGIGTCSLCGGLVELPSIWGGCMPPVPTCSRCGAQAAAPRKPVIPMVPSPAPLPWPELIPWHQPASIGDPPPGTESTITCSLQSAPDLQARAREVPEALRLRGYTTTRVQE